MADKRINELEEALSITAADLFVMQQANTAKKLSGQTMIAFLTALADGHGGIASILKTGSAGTPVVDTYTITYADGSTGSFTVTNGEKGDQGIQGPQGIPGEGVTISSTSVRYQAGTSGTVYPTGNWVGNPPSVEQGGYLWTRTIVNYSDGAQTVSYSVSRMGVDGSGAVSTVCGVNPDGSGNVALTASDVGALPTSYQAPVTSVNGDSGDVNLTAADVSAVPVSGSDGFLYRSSGAIGQKELGKILWENENGWNSGTLTINGISNYKAFLIHFMTSAGVKYSVVAFGAFSQENANGSKSLHAYVSYAGTELNTVSGLYFLATAVGDTLTFKRCAYITGTSVASNDHKIWRIVGLV